MKYYFKTISNLCCILLLIITPSFLHAGQSAHIPSLEQLCTTVLREKTIPPLTPVKSVDYALFKTIVTKPTHPDITVIEDLLIQGADPNFEHPQYYRLPNGYLLAAPSSMAGLTPLGILSTQQLFTPQMQHTARLLLTYGADINKKIASLHPPLGIAIKAINVDFVRYALDNGADPHTVNRFNMLEYMMQFYHYNQNACYTNMLALLEHGYGNKITHICFIKAIQKNDELMLDLLNDYNTVVSLREIRYQDNKTIFHIAATSNNPSVCKKVFEHARSIDLHMPDHSGKSPLDILQEHPNDEMRLIKDQYASYPHSAVWLATKVSSYLCP